MNNESNAQSSAITRFRALHQSGCFVLPNPWDLGTSVYLQHLGFKALATTSAGAAFALGKPDTVSAVPRNVMLAHIRDVVNATPLPVNADYQTGYADKPEGVAANVSLCIATGVAGLSIEDTAAALAKACGHWGTGAEYLLNTVQHLEALGIHDRFLWRLQQRVAEKIRSAED